MSTLKGICKINGTNIRGGLSEKSEQFQQAEMKFGGIVREFFYKDYMTRLKESSRNSDNTLDLEIEFVNDLQKREFCEFDPTDFIGELMLNEDKEGFYVLARVALPSSMFLDLRSMRGDKIGVQIAFKVIDSPSEEQKIDHIIGLVKRVSFEIT